MKNSVGGDFRYMRRLFNSFNCISEEEQLRVAIFNSLWNIYFTGKKKNRNCNLFMQIFSLGLYFVGFYDEKKILKMVLNKNHV